MNSRQTHWETWIWPLRKFQFSSLLVIINSIVTRKKCSQIRRQRNWVDLHCVNLDIVVREAVVIDIAGTAAL